MIEGKDFYWQNGYKVFTAEYHLKRDRCCGNGCRHCPWKNKKRKMRFQDTIYIDMDGVLCDFVGQAEKVLGAQLPPEDTEERKNAIDDCQLIPGFYLSLEPLPGAIDAYHALWSKYKVEVLTAPSWDNPHSWSEKRLWCEKYLGDKVYKRLTQTHNKGFFSGRALIDDRIKYGVEEFQGEHIHFGTEKFPDWDSVIKYLL